MGPDGSAAADAEGPLLAGLTPPQREAVLATEGPVLILAGPGSGKTRVITRRIAHLIGMGVPPWGVLALTFTNKAAAEMRERVHALLTTGDAASDERRMRGLTVTTFHSLCARMLRRYAGAAGASGVTGTFSIYDSGDQQSLMKRVIADAGLNTSNFPPGSVLHHISAAKNRLLDAAGYAREAHDFHSKTVARLYAAYERALRAANAVDFDDLLLLAARVLREDAAVAREVRERWQYLMIDEYQDTNHAQFVLASLIARREDGGRPNICVVGDPDQSIYGWRGADIGNILEFEEQFPGARLVMLGENFRSTAPILAAADALIRKNKRRKHKPLFTARQGGERPILILCRDERHEAGVVVDWLRAQREEAAGATPWREMAVFYRTNALSRALEDALRGAGVPYVIARGTAFYDREEVKDALAYLRVVANPADDVSLLRIVNKPARGIGATTLDRLREEASGRGEPVLETLRRAAKAGQTRDVSARAANAIGAFLATLDAWTSGGAFLGGEVPGSLHALVDRVVRESGLEKHYSPKKDAGDEGEDRLENLAELVSSAKAFEEEYDVAADPSLEAPRDDAPGAAAPPLLAMLRGYLESVALVADADAIDPEQGAVTLMTLHAAKGLEFEAAAMVGLEEGLLPHSRARESESELEEERRLAFVGITRAKARLLLTAAKYRTIRGLTERSIPSQFLHELGAGAVSVSDQSDMLGDLDDRGRQAEGTPHSAYPARAAEADGFPVGARVRHPQFGVGTVRESTGGVDARVRVAFQGAGEKTLIVRYARLERLG